MKRIGSHIVCVVEIYINKQGKESCRYTFEPVDEGEFRLESDYKDNVVYIKCTFYIVDMMENEGIEDNIFVIETTYFMLYEFLIQLRKEYNMVK